MAALHPHQCCVSSLLMLHFMTHIAHNDAITTSSLHHSFSHYETAFLYIKGQSCPCFGQSIQVIFSGFYFSLGQVQSKLNLSDYSIRECHITLLSHITHDICLHHIESSVFKV